MNRRFILSLVALVTLQLTSCNASIKTKENLPEAPKRYPAFVQTGCENVGTYMHLLSGKRVAVLVNHTSLFSNGTHLVDSFQKRGINLVTIFAPEHGFRGTADAGAHIQNQIDPISKLPVISLYGSKKKPTAADLQGIDVLVFDIQDVGARFYTYISSMYYMMQACAENKKSMIILDRPNPNGFYVDGPVLDMKYQSFVGIIPVPVVHGCTVGELAQMINEEGWLGANLHCDITVSRCKNYTHISTYTLPVAPSPNLKNSRAVYLYPSLCFFEGTEVSVARGTSYAFQAIGSPYIKKHDSLFSFTPKSISGASQPPFKDQVCFGFDLREDDFIPPVYESRLDISYLIEMYSMFNNKSMFFHSDNFFEKLAGTDELRKQIEAGLSEKEIRASWAEELQAYKILRKKYLLYDDFE